MLDAAPLNEVTQILDAVFSRLWGYVLFRNGTLVMLPEAVSDLRSAAMTVMEKMGHVAAGTPFGDFGVRKLLHEWGHLVTSHSDKIVTFVYSRQWPDFEPAEIAIGLYGRSMRQKDAEARDIIHVRTPG